MEIKLIQLGWKLIEYKLMYYCNEKFDLAFLAKNAPSDAIYDLLEARYVRLCKLLGKKNTVQNMVGIDLNRPSVQTALAKLEAKGGATKKIRRYRKKEFTNYLEKHKLQ